MLLNICCQGTNVKLKVNDYWWVLESAQIKIRREAESKKNMWREFISAPAVHSRVFLLLNDLSYSSLEICFEDSYRWFHCYILKKVWFHAVLTADNQNCSSRLSLNNPLKKVQTRQCSFWKPLLDPTPFLFIVLLVSAPSTPRAEAKFLLVLIVKEYFLPPSVQFYLHPPGSIRQTVVALTS